MKEKLLALMRQESLTASRLAELLEIQPSGISHLLSGRNKPGFDLIQKILRRFPRINPDWLLLDSSVMLRDDIATSSSELKNQTAKLHDLSAGLFDHNPVLPQPDTQISQTPLTFAQTEVASTIAQEIGSSAVSRIIVIYADKTFESFSPKR